MDRPFNTLEMAVGYARSRPPVHRHIINRAMPYLPVFCVRALDVGCGAGLSTSVLESVAEKRFGVEQAESMLQSAAKVSTSARFAVGAAEMLPFPDGSMDLITAAGSLNYVELDRFWPQAAGVLSSHGLLLVYDFSPGRTFAENPGLEEWFADFDRRYPAPYGEAQFLNPDILAERASGFVAISRDIFSVRLPLTRDSYIDYVLTETNVASAVRCGESIEAIRAWCEETLKAIWPGPSDTPREILFPSYFICLKLQSAGHRS